MRSAGVQVVKAGGELGLGDVVLLKAAALNDSQRLPELALMGWEKYGVQVPSAVFGIGNPCGDKQKYFYSNDFQGGEILFDNQDQELILGKLQEGGLQGGFSGGGVFMESNGIYYGPVKGAVGFPNGTSCDPNTLAEVGVEYFGAYAAAGILAGYAAGNSMPTVRLGSGAPQGTILPGQSKEYSGWPDVVITPFFWAQYGSEVRVFVQ